MLHLHTLTIFVDAAANGFERVYHYNAIGIEPHIALCSSAGSENAPTKLGHQPSSAAVASPLLVAGAAKNTSQFDGTSGLPVTTNKGDAKPQSHLSPIAIDQNPQSLPSTSTPKWESPPSDIPWRRAEDMMSWTDDDIADTDYENMPDYDPNRFRRLETAISSIYMYSCGGKSFWYLQGGTESARYCYESILRYERVDIEHLPYLLIMISAFLSPIK